MRSFSKKQNTYLHAITRTLLLSATLLMIVSFQTGVAHAAPLASFEKYYRTNDNPLKNGYTNRPSCPSGWTVIDEWAVDEGDHADGYGDWHGGVSCSSAAYTAASSKYYRDRSPTGSNVWGNLNCPAGWTQLEEWVINEGESADGGGGDHRGKACVLNSGGNVAVFSKYYRTKDDPTNGYTKRPSCPSGWTVIDEWAVDEGDHADGYGDWHGGVSCSSAAYSAASSKYWRQRDSSNAWGNFGCPSGWTRVDAWLGVSEGDPGDGGGGLHDGIACALPITTGTLIHKATKTEGGSTVDWDSPSFIIAYDAPYGASQTATIDPLQTLADMPTGQYTIKSITLPSIMSGVTLQNVNGSSLPYGQFLSPGGTTTFKFNFKSAPVEPASGTIIIRTTKDDGNGPQPWDSPSFTVNYTGPGGTTDATIDTDASGQQTLPESMTGTYTFNGVCSDCLPAGVTFSNVVPQSQELAEKGVIAFTFNFTTSVVPPPAPTLTVSPSSASVQINGTQPFSAIYDPDGSGPQSPQTVTNSAGWSSSSDSIATVSGTGVATGKSVGSASIKASYSGLEASAALAVTEPVPALDIVPSSTSIAIGGTKQFNAIYDPDGSGPQPSQDVTASAVWSSLDTAKVTISSGLAERIGHGTASVSASYSGLSDSATVLDPARIRVIPASKSLQYGETVQLSACLDPNGTVSVPSGTETCPAGTTSVTDSSNWTSNKPTRAQVDNSSSKGLVTAQNTSGSAIIRASYGGFTGSASIQVSAPPVAPLTVSCSASPTSTITGQPVTWTASASGGTGSYSYLWLGSSPLNGKTSNPVTVTYTTTTPNPKTGRVRVTSGGQTVTQDCTTSVTVNTPPPPPPPPTATLSANPEIIDEGQSSTLTWTSTNNATSCDSSDFSTGGLPSNTSSDVNPDVQVSPSRDTTYRIYCTNSGGSGPVASATVTVVSVKASINAKPSCINGGGNSKISWSATPTAQVVSCNVSGPGLSSSQISGSQTVNITSKSAYKIECRTISDSIVTKQVIVDIAGCWSEF